MVLAGSVHEMVATDAIAVAVAAGGDHFDAGIGEFGSPRDRQRATVDRVEPVAVEVAVELAGTTDSGTQQHLFGRFTEFFGGTL